jgi:hypothetical protein
MIGYSLCICFSHQATNIVCVCGVLSSPLQVVYRHPVIIQLIAQHVTRTASVLMHAAP